MKVIFVDDAMHGPDKATYINGINFVKDQTSLRTFPEFDEQFEKEFNCTILYNRDKAVLGFAWKNDADYSWFMLRCS